MKLSIVLAVVWIQLHKPFRRFTRLKMKKLSLLSVLILCLVLSSCAPGAQYTLPPNITLIPGTDIPQQVATIVSGALTQTASPPTATPIPEIPTLPTTSSFSQKLYQSPTLGIQFAYPDSWYVQESTSSPDIFGISTPVPGISLTSFDPSNPPHKLEWTEQTVSIQFRAIPYVMVQFHSSLDEWAEISRQAALASQLTIYEEERFLIANQPAIRLALSSGSGGVIHQVLTILNGQHFEIDIQGNLNIARTILASIQPVVFNTIKPADSDTPAAGICGEQPGDPVIIILGNDPSGLPKGGRCIIVNPVQRIKLVNQSNGPFGIKFAEYVINLPVGDELLLDRPVGEYLALGVHNLPMAPALWVRQPVPEPVPSPIPLPTMPGPLRNYSNPEVGYSLTLLPGWNVDENGLPGLNKEVVFYPSNAEPFIAYLSILLDSRTLEQIMQLYLQSVPDAVSEDTVFNGYPGIKYTYNWGRVEYYIPVEGRIFMITTDKPLDGDVQQTLMSIRFDPVTVVRYTNGILGYSLTLPPDWIVDENGVGGLNREVRIYPVNAEPFVSYLDIGLDPRSLDFLKAQDVPDATKQDIFIAGQNGVEYIYNSGHIEIYLSYNGQVYYLYSDKPSDENIGNMIGSFRFP